jgi:hypothetical protein
MEFVEAGTDELRKEDLAAMPIDTLALIDKDRVMAPDWRRPHERKVCMINRRRSGVSLVEFGAAMALGLPLILIMLYAVLEANYLFTIRTHLDQATREAGRQLMSKYQKDPTPANNTSANSNTVTNTINLPGFVVSSSQFNVVYSYAPPSPSTVTVTCTYPTGGAAGLMPFPAPDPLGLGPSFSISATGTFPLD